MSIGIAWLVHDRYRTSFGIIVPAMLVVLGVLMLIARSAAIPDRRAGAKTPPSN